jgi:hypothetical protein
VHQALTLPDAQATPPQEGTARTDEAENAVVDQRGRSRRGQLFLGGKGSGSAGRPSMLSGL